MTDQIPLANGGFVTVAQLEAAYRSGTAPKFEIDTNWFMTQGPGKYIYPSMFQAVNDLFLDGYSPGVYNLVGNNNTPGIFNRDVKTDYNKITTTISNYMTDIKNPNFDLRAWVFGTSSFIITGGKVYVDALGNPEIRDLEIKPLDDNFNFNTREKPWYVVAANTEWNLINDPSGVGRGVDLEFRNQPGKIFGSVTDDNVESFRPPELNQPVALPLVVKAFDKAFGRWAESVKMTNCFLAGTPILMADGTEKPIEAIKPGDRVMSFDAAKNKGRGGLVPGEVARTFRNVAKTVIDLHGLKVTPGHRFLTGEGTFETIAEILRRDGTIVTVDRGEVRARTNVKVGSPEDRPVQITYTHTDGRTYKVVARAGIPCLRHVAEKRLCSLAEMPERHWHGEVLPDGLVRAGGVDAPVHWPEGTPVDTAAQLNFVIADIFGRPYVPAWIAGLSEDEDGLMEAVGDAGRPGSSRSARAPGTAAFRPTLAASNARPPNRRERRRAAALERVR
jgi:hypothetical protein